MEQHDVTPELPQQEVGAKTDIEVVEQFDNTNEAQQLYNAAKSKLLNVNAWHELCGSLSAGFALVDEKGGAANRQAKVNDYFKIDIPGPGTSKGKGYDWVQVENIENKKDEFTDSESIIMTVRPAENPCKKDGDIAHFFSEEATSNFTLIRNATRVTAGVHGRNELPNIKADKLIDKARNAIVGTSALAGFSNPQWTKLVNAWLGKS